MATKVVVKSILSEIHNQILICLLILYDKKAIALLLCEFIVIIKIRDKKDYEANLLYNKICAINRFY